MSEENLNLPRPSPDQGSLELTEDYIRLRAYFLYQERGCENGHDMEDWLRAEAEILGKKEPAAEPIAKTTPLEVAAARVAAAA